MELHEMIAELTAKDAQALPDVVKEAIIAEYEAKSETQNRIAELENSVKETTARVTEIEAERDELKTQVVEYQHKAFEADVTAKIAELLDWPVNDDDGKAKLESLRKNMRRSLLAEIAAREDADLDAVVTELWDGEFKALAETMRDALAGPAAVVGGMARPNGVIAELEEKYGTPEAQHAAGAVLGIVGG